MRSGLSTPPVSRRTEVTALAAARWKKICVDAVDPVRLGQFWAAVLDLRWEADADGEGGLVGPSGRHTLWFNRVPEPKTVKHRVHLDVYAASIADLEALGSTVVLPQGEDRRWTVMADVEGGEYCAFLRREPPGQRLHGLVVDSVDPAAQARWWAQVLGAQVVDHEGYSTAVQAPGLPGVSLDFVPVPEPKTAPNRVHWDIAVADVDALVGRGARVLRPLGGDIAWQVLADPEGNEVCAFVEGPDDR